jgi:small-conductance mechanosensitive channel
MFAMQNNTIEGEVISIDLLSVKLLTLDNVYIRLPNEQLIRGDNELLHLVEPHGL